MTSVILSIALFMSGIPVAILISRHFASTTLSAYFDSPRLFPSTEFPEYLVDPFHPPETGPDDAFPFTVTIVNDGVRPIKNLEPLRIVLPVGVRFTDVRLSRVEPAGRTVNVGSLDVDGRSVIECVCPLLNRAELVEVSAVANRRILETELAVVLNADDLPPWLEVSRRPEILLRQRTRFLYWFDVAYGFFALASATALLVLLKAFPRPWHLRWTLVWTVPLEITLVLMMLTGFGYGLAVSKHAWTRVVRGPDPHDTFPSPAEWLLIAELRDRHYRDQHRGSTGH